MRENILNSIYEIFNKETNAIINIDNMKLLYNTQKYTKKNIHVWEIYINNILLKKKSNLIIKYNCITCNINNIISTTQFIRKINKCSIKCSNCNYINNTGNKSLIEQYKDSINEFNNLPDEFKKSYLLNHLLEIDYNRIKSNIIGFCNGNKNDLYNYELWSIFKENNLKFITVIYDKLNNTIFKPDQPLIKCNECNKSYKINNINQLKNSCNILCHECKLLNNKNIKIKIIYNLLHEPIIYQSKLELKFIKWIHSEGIIINNGPCIKFIYENKEYNYKITFKINNDIMVDIQNNNIDYNINYDIIYPEINKIYKYYLITPKNWNHIINQIKKSICLNKLNKI